VRVTIFISPATMEHEPALLNAKTCLCRRAIRVGRLVALLFGAEDIREIEPANALKKLA